MRRIREPSLGGRMGGGLTLIYEMLVVGVQRAEQRCRTWLETMKGIVVGVGAVDCKTFQGTRIDTRDSHRLSPRYSLFAFFVEGV